jgi:glycosyltransferase involved in cell wall biosynthesis
MAAPGETLVVIVPCFNEEHNLRQTVESIREVARELPLAVEILLIDDGSTDGTRHLIEELCGQGGCQSIINERNLGMGRSLVNAYRQLRPGTWVTVLPGDNEIDFASIKGFVALRDRYDLILGYFQNPIIRPLGRRLVSMGYLRLVQFLYGFPFRYLNGLKLFKVEVFQGIEVQSAGHAYVSELLAKAILRNPGLRIGEAPFIARGRATGNSKAIRPRSVLQAIREVGTGLRVVARYRDEIIRRGDGDHGGAGAGER